MEILPKMHYIYLFKNSSEKRETTNSMAYSYRRLRAGSTENRRVRMVSRLLLERRGHTCISGPSPCAFPNIHPYHSLTSYTKVISSLRPSSPCYSKFQPHSSNIYFYLYPLGFIFPLYNLSFFSIL